jgi:hypothetical protein
MRKSYDGLQALARHAMQRAPLDGALYVIDDDIRVRALTGEEKRLHRLTHSKPFVDHFFFWVDWQLHRPDLIPSSPFAKALGYARQRRAGLEVFLSDPDVPMDPNHLERALHVIPMGRKNRFLCSTEVGAKHVGIV